MAKEDTGIGPYAIFAGLGLAGGAYLWYRSKKIAPKPPLTGKATVVSIVKTSTPSSNSEIKPLLGVKKVLGPVLIKPEIMSLMYKTAKAAGLKGAKPIMPTFKEVSGHVSEYKIKSGLLGQIVSASWVYAHQRLWYMSRCRQYHPFDDTSEWNARSDHNVPKDRYKENTSKVDRGTWPIGIHNGFYDERYYGGKISSHNTYKRLTSLDVTFPNWSWPFGGWLNVFGQGGQLHSHYSNGSLTKDCWIYCGIRRPLGSSHSKCLPKDCNKYRMSTSFNLENSLNIGDIFNGNSIANSVFTARAYKYLNNEWADDKAWAGVVEKEIKAIQSELVSGKFRALSINENAFPGRIYSNKVPYERNKATYLIKIPQTYKDSLYKTGLSSEDNQKTIEQKFISDISTYYRNGYNLVNTVLDILIDRGCEDLEKEFPSFVTHCNWWWILPPKKSMLKYAIDKDGDLVRMPRLSDIGAGSVGLSGISNQELVSYIMYIAPKPGTIPPWEDKGPLWGWPAAAGQMVPAYGWGTPFASGGFESMHSGTYLRSASSSKWTSWNNFIAYALNAVNDAAYSYVMKEAGSAVSGIVTDVACEWINTVSDDVMNKLAQKLAYKFDNIIDMASKIAAFGAMVENVDLANELVPKINKSFAGGTALNSFNVIKDYLTNVADGAPKSIINDGKNKLDIVLKDLKTWGWCDDLIGEMGSIGSDFGNVSTIKSGLGFYG